ncbi:hypothetical protein WJ17_25340 [Burkholderia vietnamiensis]|nr:hypothetical protein WJ17_25340 [Burkholderia vietnamiensis]
MLGRAAARSWQHFGACTDSIDEPRDAARCITANSTCAASRVAPPREPTHARHTPQRPNEPQPRSPVRSRS